MTYDIRFEEADKPVETRVGDATIIRTVYRDGRIWGYVLEVAQPMRRYMLVAQDQDLFAVNFSLKTNGQLQAVTDYALKIINGAHDDPASSPPVDQTGHQRVAYRSTHRSGPRAFGWLLFGLGISVTIILFLVVRHGLPMLLLSPIIAGIVLGFIMGLLSLTSPHTAWYLTRGWRYKNLEPSDAGIFFVRVQGCLSLIVVVAVLAICFFGMATWR